MRIFHVLAALAIGAVLAACAPAAPPALRDTGRSIPARDAAAAAAFEAWMQPRLDAVQLMLDASQQAGAFVALIVRARQPGTGVEPPAVAPAVAALVQAAAATRRDLAGLPPFAAGDDEQMALASDVQDQVVRMRAGLEACADGLPRLAAIALELGPLARADAAILGASLIRLLDVQVRADMVFADLVAGLLTPDSDLLPERELQAARWRGNAILLRAIDGFATAGAPDAAMRAEIDAVAAERGEALRAALGKIAALKRAAAELPYAQRGAIGRVIRVYEDGLEAEADFLDAVARFAPLAEDPDTQARLAGALDGARPLMDSLVQRLRANLSRLRTLTELGAGPRA
jgi:hypothetical protein